MKRIWVAGDFFRDVFNIGSYKPGTLRFQVEEQVRRAGGASNTYSNLMSICKNTDIEVERVGDVNHRTLTRYIIDSRVILESWNVADSQLNKLAPARRPWHYYYRGSLSFQKADWETMVVSDYNKGAVNIMDGNDAPLSVKPIDLLVVDSRYRTLNPDILKLARTSIWRCTDTEFDPEWAKQFDYVVWTSHDDAVYTFSKDQLIGTMFPPTIDAVDPCGAGDTFTGALAAWLTHVGKIDEETLAAAVRFATIAAQDVCLKAYTAVTSTKLE